jgi:hypothetical protein
MAFFTIFARSLERRSWASDLRSTGADFGQKCINAHHVLRASRCDRIKASRGLWFVVQGRHPAGAD